MIYTVSGQNYGLLNSDTERVGIIHSPLFTLLLQIGEDWVQLGQLLPKELHFERTAPYLSGFPYSKEFRSLAVSSLSTKASHAGLALLRQSGDAS